MTFCFLGAPTAYVAVQFRILSFLKENIRDILCSPLDGLRGLCWDVLLCLYLLLLLRRPADRLVLSVGAILLLR